MIIKQKPSDFVVNEVIKLPIKKSGDYTYFELKKTNYTTMRAIQQIARQLRVSKSRFGFAGNKDKVAITTQAVSIWRVDPSEVNLKDIKIKVLGKGDEPINLGDLKENAFEIIVRKLSKKELSNISKNKPKIEKNGFVNLFGPQRFGSKLNNHIVGRLLLDGKLEAAIKEMLGSSERDWRDWKKLLKKVPKHLSQEKAVLNWLITHPTDWGGALRKIPKPVRRLFVNAYQSDIWNQKAKKSKSKTLKIPAIKVAKMPELSLVGAERAVRVKPKSFEVDTKKATITLKFRLPKGAYATVLIEQLIGDKL